ncbi:MAG: hypothetical protein QOF89_5046 [Acidobacteriota bacterium]|jgi:hypothetical protein|nr:hypothetical protein [Acidobacteriota bacterium]
MKMKMTVLSALLVLAAAGVATAQSFQVNWPISNHQYFCAWTKPDPNHPGGVISGNSYVTFRDLIGNNYLRRGTLETVYLDYSSTSTPVTVTKPEFISVNNTKFELTTGSGIQCKDFETFASSTNSVSNLYFAQCSNGAVQQCF